MDSYLSLIVNSTTSALVDVGISATSRLIHGFHDRLQEDALNSNHLQIEEHLREQPNHIAVDYNTKEVAFVKRQGEWFAIRCRDSELTVEPVTRFMMSVKKRLWAGASMRVSWVRLQTGARPKLTTRKPNGHQGDWVTIPLVKGGASSSQGSSPSWRQVARLLGVQLTLDPSLHSNNNMMNNINNSDNNNSNMNNNNMNNAYNVGEPVAVPLPIAVLFSLLATAAKLQSGLQARVTTTGDYNTMHVQDFADSSIYTKFSRDLDRGMVFLVRSNWNFSAMLD